MVLLAWGDGYSRAVCTCVPSLETTQVGDAEPQPIGAAAGGRVPLQVRPMSICAEPWPSSNSGSTAAHWRPRGGGRAGVAGAGRRPAGAGPGGRAPDGRGRGGSRGGVRLRSSGTSFDGQIGGEQRGGFAAPGGQAAGDV